MIKPRVFDLLLSMKKIKIVVLFLFLQLLTTEAFSTITILNVSGSSRYNATSKSVYGGLAGASAGESGLCGATTSTCNTCTATPQPLSACNENAILPATILTITFRSDNASGTARMADGTNTFGDTEPYVKGADVSLAIPWADLCDGLADLNTACADAGSGKDVLTIGIDSDNNGTIDDSTTLNIIVRDLEDNNADGSIVDDDPNSDGDCDETDGAVTCEGGVTNFKFFPGDEKAYLNSLTATNQIGVGDGNSTTGVIVLFAEITDVLGDGFCNDLAAGGISNNSANAILETNEGSSDLKTNKIEGGLQNGSTYVGTAGLIDEAGNIGYFYNIYGVGACVENKHTVKPRPVSGLLDDNVNCFISTAAFGSPFHAKVAKFREFRDKVLSKTTWGQNFIQFYYKNSPPLANYIAQNETLRAATRILLWPLWIFSILAIQVGMLGAISVVIFSIGLCIWVVRKISFKQVLKKSLFSIFILAICLTVGLTICLSLPSTAQAQEDFFNIDQNKTPAPTTAPTVAPTTTETPPQEPPYTGNEIEEIEDSNQRSTGVEEDVNERDAVQTDQFNTQNPNKWKEERRVPEEDRLKELADEGLFKITAKGEYLYDVKASPQKSSASLRGSMVNFDFLENPVNGTQFSDVYEDDAKLLLIFDYEWQFFQSAIGKVGLKLATGLMAANGNGQFAANDPYTDPDTGEVITDSKENFLFLFFPNTMSLVYRMQFNDKQWLVPFAEAGISYFTFIESEESGDEIKFGGAPHFNFALGGSFLLDVLGRESVLGLDRDYGVNHLWLTAEYRRFENLGSDFDFTSDIFSAGLMVEF